MEPQDTRFRSKNAHKNTSVFIGDNIIEPSVFSSTVFAAFSEEKTENQTKTKTGKPQVWIMGGGGGDFIYLSIY